MRGGTYATLLPADGMQVQGVGVFERREQIKAQQKSMTRRQ
jgi:hypothetical protein